MLVHLVSLSSPESCYYDAGPSTAVCTFNFSEINNSALIFFFCRHLLLPLLRQLFALKSTRWRRVALASRQLRSGRKTQASGAVLLLLLIQNQTEFFFSFEIIGTFFRYHMSLLSCSRTCALEIFISVCTAHHLCTCQHVIQSVLC